MLFVLILFCDECGGKVNIAKTRWVDTSPFAASCGACMPSTGRLSTRSDTAVLSTRPPEPEDVRDGNGEAKDGRTVLQILCFF